jgi:hypothetical protein
MRLLQKSLRRDSIDARNIRAQFNTKLLPTFVRFFEINNGRQRRVLQRNPRSTGRRF